MSEWDNRVASDPGVHALRTVEDLRTRPPAQPLDETYRQRLERVFRITEMARDLLDSTDARLITPGMLSPLSQFANVRNHLDVFFNTNSVHEIDNANSQAENVLEGIRAWPTNLAGRKAARLEVAELQRKLMTEYEGARSALMQSTDELARDVENRRNELSSLSNRVQDVAGATDAYEKTIAEQLKTIQDRFEAAEADRIDETAKRIADSIENGEKRFRRTIEAAASEATSAIQEIDVQLADAQEKKSELDKLLGIAGENSQSTGFGVAADAERASANTMRYGAIVTGIVWSAVAVFLFAFDSDPTALDFDSIASRLAVTAPIVVIFFYFVREAAQHRRAERLASRLQLGLSALGPYLAELTPEKRGAVKTDMTQTFFRVDDLISTQESSRRRLKIRGQHPATSALDLVSGEAEVDA